MRRAGLCFFVCWLARASQLERGFPKMSLQETDPRPRRQRRRRKRTQRPISTRKKKRQQQRTPLPWLRGSDASVLSFREWCQLNGIGERTGRRILKSGNGPAVVQLSERRIGIRLGDNRIGKPRGCAGECAAEKRRPSGAVGPKTADVMICLGGGSARKLLLNVPLV